MEARSGIQYDLNIGFERKEFEDPYTLEFIIDPVKTACEHYLERATAEILHNSSKPCPLCRQPIYPLQNVDRIYLDIRTRVLLANPQLYADMPFDLDQFTEVLRKNEVNTKEGEWLLTILRHAANHLNDKADTGKQQGKSAVEVLASSPLGRNLLREYEGMQTLISDENKQRIVDGKTIAEWLSLPSEAMEAKAEVKKSTRKKKVKHPRPIAPRPGLFTQNPGNRLIPRPNYRLDSVRTSAVYGNESDVARKIRLDRDLIFYQSIVIDHVGREINYASPYQIALRCGDMELAKMIKRVALKSNIPNAQQKLDDQYMEVFPNGYEEHLREQQANTFDFSSIINAISRMEYSNIDLLAALYKVNNGSDLCHRLDEFRNLFTAHSLSEKVYNPYHLQKAFDLYLSESFSWSANQKKLLWKQVIGYVERYMPVCYMQAFCQGLYGLTDKKPRNALVRNDKCQNDITYRHITLSSLDEDPACRLGFDFAVYSIYGGCDASDSLVGDEPINRFYKPYVEQKNRDCRALAPRTPGVFSRIRSSLR